MSNASRRHQGKVQDDRSCRTLNYDILSERSGKDDIDTDKKNSKRNHDHLRKSHRVMVKRRRQDNESEVSKKSNVSVITLKQSRRRERPMSASVDVGSLRIKGFKNVKNSKDD